MRRCSYHDLEDEQDRFAESVESANYLAKFCSEVPWQTAALRNLGGGDSGIQVPGESFIVEEDGNWLAFTERNRGVLYPLESAWMFGCPLVGEPRATLRLLENACERFLGSGFGFVISGVREESAMHQALLGMADKARRFDIFPGTDCLTIDLSGGVDLFLSRRSRSFRKGLRQLKPIESLEFEDVSELDPEVVFDRLFAVQGRSYKSKDGSDIFAHRRYEGFYRDLYRQLHRKGQIRTIFARIEGRDVAYIMGGVSGSIYRGFQMSYDDEFRAFGLGNRLQIENIRRRCEEGVRHYDLGMHSDYKERWADNWENYLVVFLVL